MTAVSWDVIALLGFCLASVVYIVLAIVIYAHNEQP